MGREEEEGVPKGKSLKEFPKGKQEGGKAWEGKLKVLPDGDQPVGENWSDDVQYATR